MDLDELRVLVAIVDRGSIAAASKTLRFPVATLRRRLDELETRMGAKLVERTRHGAVATSAGLLLADKAREVLSDVQSLADLVRNVGTEPSGEVVVALPVGLPPTLVGAFFGATMERYPELRWRALVVDDPVRALSGGAHAAIWLGDRAPEGPWVARRLLSLREGLLATQAYLARHGTPSSVEDLVLHTLLVWEGPGRRGDDLPLLDGGTLRIAPALRMTDIFLLRMCAARGCGIAFAPDGLPGSALTGDDGLVRVLERVVGGCLSVWMLADSPTWKLPRMRAAFEELEALVAPLNA